VGEQGSTTSRRSLSWWVAFAAATALVMLWTLQLYFAPPAPRRGLLFGQVLAIQAITWYTWLALLPLILHLACRLRRAQRSWRAELPVQLLVAALVAIVYAHSS
jgi:hypothetical protein